MNNDIELLDWDSDFFGIKIGRIICNNTSYMNLLAAVENLKKSEIRLAYYSSPEPIAIKNFENSGYSFHLVDEKITYLKPVTNNIFYSDIIAPFNENYPTDQLFNLATESGIYSRFNVDKKIGRKKYEELYKQWIINSVNKKLAKEVLVYKTGETITGFITVGEKNLIADIGIIAVSNEQRGKGIGKHLMYAAENWFVKHNYKFAHVVTQKNNIPACRLYESCGYKINKIEYFYHIWKNNS